MHDPGFASQHGKSQVAGHRKHEHLWQAFDPFCLPAGLGGALGEPGTHLPDEEIHDNTPDKNDAKDTYIISELMSMGKLLQYNKQRYFVRKELRSLHRHRHQLTKQLTQLCNRAEPGSQRSGASS